MGDLGLGQALVMGFAQALALAPGVSRSGITITAGRFMKLDRDSAARFSFLLLIPTVLGAVLLKGVKDVSARRSSERLAGPFLVGTLAALGSGLLASTGCSASSARHTYGVVRRLSARRRGARAARDRRVRRARATVLARRVDPCARDRDSSAVLAESGDRASRPHVALSCSRVSVRRSAVRSQASAPARSRDLLRVDRSERGPRHLRGARTDSATRRERSCDVALRHGRVVWHSPVSRRESEAPRISASCSAPSRRRRLTLAVAALDRAGAEIPRGKSMGTIFTVAVACAVASLLDSRAFDRARHGLHRDAALLGLGAAMISCCCGWDDDTCRVPPRARCRHDRTRGIHRQRPVSLGRSRDACAAEAVTGAVRFCPTATGTRVAARRRSRARGRGGGSDRMRP